MALESGQWITDSGGWNRTGVFDLRFGVGHFYKVVLEDAHQLKLGVNKRHNRFAGRKAVRPSSLMEIRPRNKQWAGGYGQWTALKHKCGGMGGAP